jgi:fucose 4-O-acetylase-like acetyltransferase
MKEVKSTRIEWLSFVRGISIVCIVIGHCNASPLITRIVFSFHVPIFFIISGFLFAENKSLTLRFDQIVRKKFRSAILPYITTAFILYFCIIATYLFYWNLVYYHNQVFNLSYPFILGIKLFLNFCYGTGAVVNQFKTVIEPVGTLWFLPSFFCSSVIFYFVIKLIHTYTITIQLIIIIILTFVGYTIGKYLFLPWSIDISLVSQLFMFSGYLMSKNQIYKNMISIWLVIVAVCMWLFDLYMGDFNLNERIYSNFAVVSMAGAIAGSSLLMYVSYILSKYTYTIYYRTISYIGKQSLVILCFHNLNTIIVVNPIRSFRLWLYVNNHWIILTILALGYSLLVAEIIKRISILRSIFYPK